MVPHFLSERYLAGENGTMPHPGEVAYLPEDIPPHPVCRYLILHGQSATPSVPGTWTYAIVGAVHTLSAVADYLTRTFGSTDTHSQGPHTAYGAYDCLTRSFVRAE